MFHSCYFSADNTAASSESDSTISNDADAATASCGSEVEEHGNEKTLLDLYSGCGAMSTGLCLGANTCGVKLVTVNYSSIPFPSIV